MRALSAVLLAGALCALPSIAHAQADGGVPVPSVWGDAGPPVVAEPDAGPPPVVVVDAAVPAPVPIDAAPPVVVTPPPEEHHYEAPPEREYPGTLGMRDSATVGVWAGILKNKRSTTTTMGTPPVPTTTDKTDSGQMGLLRIDFGSWARKTRFGSLVGFEFSTALGFVTEGAVPGKSLTGRLFFDFDSILDIAFHHSGSNRLMVQGGVGFNLDAYYLIAGAKMAASIGHGSLALELGYQYRRGATYGDDAVSEHRAHGMIILPKSKVGVGLEYWRGTSAPVKNDPAFRGQYQALLAILSYRWKSPER